MKVGSKRKRTQEDMEEVKEVEAAFKKDRQQAMKEFMLLRMQQQEMATQMEELGKYKQHMEDLHAKGIIDSEGNPVKKGATPKKA